MSTDHDKGPLPDEGTTAVDVYDTVQYTMVGEKKRGGLYMSRYVVKMLGATLCIAGAVATWVAMAELLQKLNKEYQKPFFMIYFVHGSYALLYAAWAMWRYFPYCFPGSFACNRVGDGALDNFRPLLIWSGLLNVILVTSSYLWYLSLARTNIPANTAIYQCASAVVFVISVPLLKERVTLVKVCSLAASIGGVFLVAFFSNHDDDCVPFSNVTNSTINSTISPGLYQDDPCDSEPEQSTPLGYVLLVVSVITYALFETLYKKFGTKKDDPAATMNGLRFLGYTGVYCMFTMWPVIIILHYSGFETFAVPPTLELFGLLVLNAVMDIVFFGCLLVCIALSSPLYATAGTIVAIPASVVVDLMVQHFLPTWQAFVGIALILIGFSGFVVSEFVELRRESRERHSDKVKDATGSGGKSRDPLSESEPLLNSSKSGELISPQRKWIRRLLTYVI